MQRIEIHYIFYAPFENLVFCFRTEKTLFD